MRYVRLTGAHPTRLFFAFFVFLFFAIDRHALTRACTGVWVCASQLVSMYISEGMNMTLSVSVACVIGVHK